MSEKHIQEFYEFWRKVGCPQCKAENWIYDSHSQRHYPYIPNGCECHACKNRFFVGDLDDFNIRYGDDIEELGLEKALETYLDCERGRKSPNDDFS